MKHEGKKFEKREVVNLSSKASLTQIGPQTRPTESRQLVA